MVFGLFTRKSDPLHSRSTSNPSPAAPSQYPITEPDITDSIALYDLVRSVPPQTLHEYTLAHLCPSSTPISISIPTPSPPSPRTLTTLTHFFNTLSPPPQLHCARCHASFFELSNTDTSCRVPHDDESALVDRPAYETLWGCCARSVEGTGDMGPPDGWCYEGRHTTDIKRARFRADSTIHDDKLTTCSAMRCFSQKRRRSVSASSDDDTSTSTRKKYKRRSKPKSIDDASPKPITTTTAATATARNNNKPASKASTSSFTKPPSKRLSKTGMTSSLAQAPRSSRPSLAKSNLHQSHVAFAHSPRAAGGTASTLVVSESELEPECESDARPRCKSTSPRDSDVPVCPPGSGSPTKIRPIITTTAAAAATATTTAIADLRPRKPRTRSTAREERSLSRTRATARGTSVRVLREREREKGNEKGTSESESEGDERGRVRGRGRGRGREAVKKMRVDVLIG